MSNNITIAILFSKSLNAQNDCPDVFFKLGEITRKIDKVKKKQIQLDSWEYGWKLN